MLSGCLVVPSQNRFERLGITREYPYGRPEEGKPAILYVCHNMVHRDLVAHTFRDRAMYILEGGVLAGNRFDHIILFDRPFGAIQGMAVDANARWNRERLPLTLRPRGTITRYTMEQQFDLGIYNYVGIDFAGPNSDHTPKKSVRSKRTGG